MESGTSTECNGQNPSVTLTSTNWQPSQTYCVTGSHSTPLGGCTTGPWCLITPGPKISSLIFEHDGTTTPLTDSNPQEGGGLRIFPDAEFKEDTSENNVVTVKAQLSVQNSGVRIYFRAIDVDDPSSSSDPVDENDTAEVKGGGDNRGQVEDSPAGQLRVPPSGQPNPYSCQVFSNSGVDGVSCLTDSNGIARVDYSVTMQPGDNFIVVASPEESYIASLELKDDGINLSDADEFVVPESNPNLIENCEQTNNRACRSEMLTVWRRLHIEYDYMGTVSGNFEENSAASAMPVPTGSVQIQLNDMLLAGDNGLQNGYAVIGNHTIPIVANDSWSITVNNSSVPFSIQEKDRITVYDDDDFNDNDAPKNGDEGESLGPATDEKSMLQQIDVPCNETAPFTICNVLFQAYIRPQVASEGSVPFKGYFREEIDEEELINYHYSLKEHQTRSDFWTIYLVNAYQYSFGDNGDPDYFIDPNALESDYDTVLVNQILDETPGASVLFVEQNRAWEYSFLNLVGTQQPHWTSRPVSRAHEAAKGVGFALGGAEDDAEDVDESTGDKTLMSGPKYRLSGVFGPITINKIRRIERIIVE